MKARLLNKLTNNSGYYPGDYGDYIAMGSPLCHDLIKVDKKTLKVTYALDTFKRGRDSLKGKDNESLIFIWDKLHELIASGEIHDIINGNDVLVSELPVWTFKDGQLIETSTDEYGWPNTTKEGVVMYENTHFPTRAEAIRKAIDENRSCVEMMTRNAAGKEKELAEYKDRLADKERHLQHFLDLSEANSPIEP